MGVLNYSGIAEYEFDDTLLAHLKIVISAKMMRKESFLMEWVIPAEEGSGRQSLWLSPSIPIVFLFSTDLPPKLNRAWVEILAEMANSNRGLQLNLGNDFLALNLSESQPQPNLVAPTKMLKKG